MSNYTVDGMVISPVVKLDSKHDIGNNLLKNSKLTVDMIPTNSK